MSKQKTEVSNRDNKGSLNPRVKGIIATVIIVLAATGVFIAVYFSTLDAKRGSDITGGDVLLYIAGIATTAGTVFLGVISIKQTQYANKQASEANKLSESSLAAERRALEEAIRANNEAAKLAEESNKISIDAVALAQKTLETESVSRVWQRVPIFSTERIRVKADTFELKDCIEIIIDTQSRTNNFCMIHFDSLEIYEGSVNTNNLISDVVWQLAPNLKTPQKIEPNGKKDFRYKLRNDVRKPKTIVLLVKIGTSNLYGEFFQQHMELVLPFISSNLSSNEVNVSYDDFNSTFYYADTAHGEYKLLQPYK